MKNLTLPLLLLLINAVTLASASSFGVSPPGLDFKNVLKGGYDEGVFFVGTAGDENMSVRIDVEGDMADWLKISPGRTFFLPAHSQKEVKITLEPPVDIASGEYVTLLNVVGAPVSSDTGGGSGVSMGLGVKVTITASVTGEQMLELKLSEINYRDTEINYPIEMSAEVMNNGNVKLNPLITLDISNSRGELVKTSEQQIENLNPKKSTRVMFEIPSGSFQTTNYTANMTARVNGEARDSKTVKFKILPEGTWVPEGILTDLTASTGTANIGDSIKVTGVFQNTGDIRTKARMIVEVYVKEKMVKAAESRELTSLAKSNVSFDTYFTADQAGRHIIKAKMAYGETETPPQVVVVEVGKPGGGGGGQNTTLLIGVIAVVVLLVVVIFYFRFVKGKR